MQQILLELQSLRRENSRWLSVEDVADYLNLKVNTIYRYVTEHRIPYKKIPGSSKLIFSRREIDTWLETDSSDDPKIHEAKTQANRILNEVQSRGL
ncbi:helix-turn-helix domain-containing protein [candidate division KSB1 bacterium]|nr:helix-turn-helix domain-containing protein [candidate division KSB1 bacterium]NIT71992.1 helix-turn-helix domain-containing protein [candidate division KSB1 bacterium]NIX71672.1 helix-turn-helix domain-containing protein [candidate division KSB1 bacterium]